MKKHQTSDEFKAQQAKDFATRAKVNMYKNLFTKVEVHKEPRFIKLADDTPNPHGKIVPPNTPASTVRKVNK